MKLKQFLVKLDKKARYFPVLLITLYQKYISPYTKRSCVFYPTCSGYTKQAIQKYGVFWGIYKGTRRILRCHPWQKNHIDPLR